MNKQHSQMLRAGKAAVSTVDLGLECMKYGHIFLYKITKMYSVHGPDRSTQGGSGIMSVLCASCGLLGGEGDRADSAWVSLCCSVTEFSPRASGVPGLHLHLTLLCCSSALCYKHFIPVFFSCRSV